MVYYTYTRKTVKHGGIVMKNKLVKILLITALTVSCLGSSFLAYNRYPEMSEKEDWDAIDKIEKLDETWKQETIDKKRDDEPYQIFELDNTRGFVIEYGESCAVACICRSTTSKGWIPDKFDHRAVQLLVNEYHWFGQYVDILRSSGYTDVDYSPAINESLKHGELTKEQADILLAGGSITNIDVKAEFEKQKGGKLAEWAEWMECNKITPDTPTVKVSTLPANVSNVSVKDISTVMYTTNGAALYSEADTEKLFMAGLADKTPVKVTGITDNGFYRVSIADVTYYIPGSQLVKN